MNDSIKRFAVTMFVLGSLFVAGEASSQMMGGMGGFSNSAADWEKVVAHTAEEEKEGKEIWDKLQAKEITCADLGDEEYEVLGEYFMGQMTGQSHAAMNAMIIQMQGEEGEEATHAAMGKRFSGCDESEAGSVGSDGWMPMMNIMGGWSSPFSKNSQNSMMNSGFGAMGGIGGIFMILWWVLIIGGIVALIKWLIASQSQGTQRRERSAREILEERYAKGEINKQEFEEKKKDLT